MKTANDFMQAIIADIVRSQTSSKSEKNNVKPMLHYFRDNTTATFDHIFNLINTYGKDHVNSIIDELRNTGAL